MSEKTFVMDGDLLDLEPKLQEMAVEKEEVEPEKDTDGASVERAFDKFMALIERILN